ncbi:MAG: glycosyltransferase family 9 protein [Planctomycetes bacterium]|nr:glycosyltransferase family 9 protein [Planctomycetota bacterium]
MILEKNINSIKNSRVYVYLKVRRFLTSMLYLTLSLFWLPVRIFRRNRVPEKVERIAILTKLKIGETVVTAPAISLLRRKFPNARIDVLCPPVVRPLFECFPEVDNILTDVSRSTLRSLRAMNYDIAINFGFRFRETLKTKLLGAKCTLGYNYLHRGFLLDYALKMPMQAGRPMWDFEEDEQVIHQSMLWAQMLAVLGVDPAEMQPPDLRVTNVDVWRKVDDLLDASGIDPSKSFIAFHPFQSNINYEWELSRWSALAEECSWRLGMPLLLLGGACDAARAKTIAENAEADVMNLAGKLSLLETIAVLYRASLLVTVDNGFAQVADAVGTPVITLFGPGSPWIWRPYRGVNTVIHRTDVPCYGCRQDRCHQSTHICMDAITVQEVVVSIERYLANDVVALAGARRTKRKTTSIHTLS